MSLISISIRCTGEGLELKLRPSANGQCNEWSGGDSQAVHEKRSGVLTQLARYS